MNEAFENYKKHEEELQKKDAWFTEFAHGIQPMIKREVETFFQEQKAQLKQEILSEISQDTRVIVNPNDVVAAINQTIRKSGF